MNRFKRFSRTWWVLASADGCLLAKGHPDPKMPPYHLDAMTDSMPALVTAPNKFTLRDVRRLWNGMVRTKYGGHAYYTRDLVHERKVRITIEEA
jgi:hypothetical protein